VSDWSRIPPAAHPIYSNGFQPSRVSGDEHTGTAPGDPKPDKVYVNVVKGLWKNHYTGQGGDAIDWMTSVFDVYHSQMTPARRKELAALRHGMPSIHFDHRDVGYDPDNKCFVIAHRDEKGRVRTIRRYLPGKEGKHRLMTSKGTHPDRFNAALARLAPGSEVWVCESEWDALAIMGLARLNGISLVAISPGGASIFRSEWAELLRPFRVVLAYDNDAAGAAGELKAFTILTQAGVRCQVFRPDLDWKDGWDLAKFEGWGHANGISPKVRWVAIRDRIHRSPRLPSGSATSSPSAPGTGSKDIPTWRDVVNTFSQSICLGPELELEHSHPFRSVYPQCLKQLAASWGVTLSRTDCMAAQSDSPVLHASERSSCLTLEKTISMGLRSGL
jgi:hypothetical protein